MNSQSTRDSRHRISINRALNSLAVAVAIFILSGCGPSQNGKTFDRAKDMWGANEQRTWAYETEPLMQPKGEKWEADIDGNIAFSPCVVGGKLYIGGLGGPILAYDAWTGRELWRHGDESTPSGICCTDGRL
jgi:outer membrane protein assembly factor BamB